MNMKPAQGNASDQRAPNLLSVSTPNPFAPFLHLHKAALKESMCVSEEEARQQWNLNKRSGTGSNSQEEPITLVLPISGQLVQI